MSPFVTALLLAAMPAGGNFLGGLLAEVIPASKRLLSISLHAAAGIIIAVVGLELMPETFKAARPWIPLAAFVAGGGVYVVMDKFLHLMQKKLIPGGSTNAAAVFLAVSVDLFSDGVLIGTGSTLAFDLALLLALGQVAADVPEGFATITNFKVAGSTRMQRFLLSASFIVPVMLGTVIGYGALRSSAPIYKYVVLALTGGILLTASVEEMITEAHQTEDTPLTTISLVAGFALYALVAVYVKRPNFS